MSRAPLRCRSCAHRTRAAGRGLPPVDRCACARGSASAARARGRRSRSPRTPRSKSYPAPWGTGGDRKRLPGRRRDPSRPPLRRTQTVRRALRPHRGRRREWHGRSARTLDAVQETRDENEVPCSLDLRDDQARRAHRCGGQGDHVLVAPWRAGGVDPHTHERRSTGTRVERSQRTLAGSRLLIAGHGVLEVDDHLVRTDGLCFRERSLGGRRGAERNATGPRGAPLLGF